jgi:tRNA modification GTPase
MEDTIAAISTPFGEGAIALIRLSGVRALEIADAVFSGKHTVAEMRSRVQHLGRIRDGERTVDEALLAIHRAPASYTGEDVVEIACHGGILVTRRILELLLARGARSAEPGEFTQRAFLTGKMDLTQAEAVMDLISAQTELALGAAHEQLEGRLGARIEGLREQLLTLLAHIEAYIDFPDEDIDPETGDALVARLDAVLGELHSLLATAGRGRILREGLRTVIFGAPNVGKSSLLNLLLGYERAIVSPTPGTTRDSIEEVINLRGIPLRLIDTAGIRDAADAVERQGIERTLRLVERADLVLRLEDASRPRVGDAHLPEAKELLVINKCDLGEDASWREIAAVRISCLQETGLAALEDGIVARVFGGTTAHRDWSVAINARHQACLQKARGFAEAARKALGEGISAEFVAEELRSALDAVGEVVGRVDTEDLLGKIFSAFCIGK